MEICCPAAVVGSIPPEPSDNAKHNMGASSVRLDAMIITLSGYGSSFPGLDIVSTIEPCLVKANLT